jgi:hypothetical protein
MQVRTSVKVGGYRWNHNETAAQGLVVRTGVQAGGFSLNHNEAAGAKKIRIA